MPHFSDEDDKEKEEAFLRVDFALFFHSFFLSFRRFKFPFPILFLAFDVFLFILFLTSHFSCDLRRLVDSSFC